MKALQGWSEADASAQAQAIRQIQELQTRTLQSRLAEDVCYDLEAELQAERQAHAATQQVVAELKRQLQVQAMELRVTSRALELRDGELAKAQREISSLMLQQAGGPLGSPEQERTACLQAKVAALEAEVRLKDMQLSRHSAAASGVGAGGYPAAKSVGQVAGSARVPAGARAHGAAGLIPAVGHLRSDRVAPSERDFEVASTVLGSSEDDSAASQAGFDAGDPVSSSSRFWCRGC